MRPRRTDVFQRVLGGLGQGIYRLSKSVPMMFFVVDAGLLRFGQPETPRAQCEIKVIRVWRGFFACVRCRCKGYPDALLERCAQMAVVSGTCSVHASSTTSDLSAPFQRSIRWPEMSCFAFKMIRTESEIARAFLDLSGGDELSTTSRSSRFLRFHVRLRYVPTASR